MKCARCCVGLFLLSFAPWSLLFAQDPAQHRRPRNTAWTWFGGVAFASRENSDFNPGFAVGVSLATAVLSHPWSMRFDAEYAHAGFARVVDSSLTPLPPSTNFDVVAVKATAIYGLFDPPFQDPVYRARLSPYLLGGFGTYLMLGSEPSAAIGIHGGVGFWFDQPPLESVELVGHDVVDQHATRYLVLLARFAL